VVPHGIALFVLVVVLVIFLVIGFVGRKRMIRRLREDVQKEE